MSDGVIRLQSIGFFVFLLCSITPQVSFAQIVVTEIMYDLKSGSDSGHEWVEVYNAGASVVKLTDWKLFENGTNHKITGVVGADTLMPYAYAVIADNREQFKVDWPNFSGQLFDSAFSLSNSGETIIFRNASSSDSVASYQSSQGAAGDGNSLNRANVSDPFVPRAPSPGLPMSSTSIPPPAPKVVPVVPVISKPAPKLKVTPTVTSSKHPVRVVPTAELPTPVEPHVQTAAVADVQPMPTRSSASYIWWVAAGGLALAACGALVAARHVGKKEWDIVEDKAE